MASLSYFFNDFVQRKNWEYSFHMISVWNIVNSFGVIDILLVSFCTSKLKIFSHIKLKRRSSLKIFITYKRFLYVVGYKLYLLTFSKILSMSWISFDFLFKENIFYFINTFKWIFRLLQLTTKFLKSATRTWTVILLNWRGLVSISNINASLLINILPIILFRVYNKKLWDFSPI